jgi:ABC-2 type transport system permease protein
MRILDITLKDISQILRDRKMFLFVLLMPLVFTIFMGFAYRGTTKATDPRLPVGIIDEETQGSAGKALKDQLQASGSIRLVIMQPGETNAALDQVRKGSLAGVVLIPADFSSRAIEATQITGGPGLVTLITDGTTSGGQAVQQVVQTAFMRALGALESARLSVQQVETVKPYAATADRQAALEEAITEASQAWQEPALTIEVQKATAQSKGSEPFGGNPYNQSSPGMIVQFAIFGLISTSSVLVVERKARTLQRMRTTSTSKAEIILGHLLAMFIVVFTQQLILVVFGQYILHVDYLSQPLATLLVMVSLSLWIAGMGMFIGTIARGDEQVVMFAMIAMFLFTALAGAWFPLEGTGPAFSALGHLLPGAYAMDGFQNVVIRGLGISSILLPSLVLAGYAALFFALALWQFKYE